MLKSRAANFGGLMRARIEGTVLQSTTGCFDCLDCANVPGLQRAASTMSQMIVWGLGLFMGCSSLISRSHQLTGAQPSRLLLRFKNCGLQARTLALQSRFALNAGEGARAPSSRAQIKAIGKNLLCSSFHRLWQQLIHYFRRRLVGE